MKRCAALLLAFAASTGHAAEPARVLILGTYHFGNPGKDMHNVEADDVLASQRQREIEALVASLARFEPTLLALEWPKALVDERWAKYRAGTLPESRNEVVQIGFRLAKAAGVERVHGIDVDGNFPYDAVAAYAAKHGQQPILDAARTRSAAMVARTNELQRTHSIGAVLHDMNLAATIDADNAFYADMLKVGGGDEQPGVALNVAWYTRNMQSCARLVQRLEPGDRAVVVFGAGHAYWLRRCVIDVPGVELVEATDYLPKD